MSALPERRSWRALSAHYADARAVHLRDLFAVGPERGERLVAQTAGL